VEPKRILITGGPVHAYLDAVKVITNRFKGGLMVRLAQDFARYDGAQVTYLHADLNAGAWSELLGRTHNLEVITHSGFEDYRKKVLALAPSMDAVVLGAAVANLIPAKPYAGKFPSHNYKPGDVIPIDFQIAPRVIDEVRKVAPKTQLFGYKLLDGVSHEELIKAAYGIVLEARAAVVFANDARNLEQKYAVTKERAVHPLRYEQLAPWIWRMLQDQYYSSLSLKTFEVPLEPEMRVKSLIHRHAERFVAVEGGYIFGTVAVRHDRGFVTTGRGKRELESIAYVPYVDHAKREVCVAGEGKASLNAPLLSRMFDNPRVDYIMHYHEQIPDLPTYPYAPPGSVRDTERPSTTSFNIEEHGCMLLFDALGRQL